MEGNDPENVDTPTDNPTKVDTNTDTQPNQDQQSPDNTNKTPTGPAANQAATNSGYWAEKRSRVGVLAAILCFFCLLGFAYWFSADEYPRGFKQGFGFCAAGLFFIFLSIIATFVILFLNKEIKIIDFVIIIVYIGGAVLYFIGGCVNAGTWNSDPYNSNALAAVYFGEATLIGLYACLIAFDYWRSICGPKGRRIFIHFVALGFGSLILFFGYATIDNSTSSAQCVAAGYFFILLAIIFYLVVNICLKNMPVVIAKHSVIEFTIACILVFGGFITCVGYWALAGDASGASKAQSYAVGYGFFVLLVSIYIGIDIKLEEYLPKRKT